MQAVSDEKRPGFVTTSTRRTALSTKKRSPLDDRLQQQFAYFRMEFVNAATNYGVTLPLDILEDNSGRMVSFVKQSGPEFILQILLTETENIHVLRMALSLLIITMSLLRRCIPPSAGGIADANSSTFNQISSDWVKTATSHICDNGAVSVCIQLLLSTYLKDIHELVVNLLTQIVCSSKEAASQMLEPLNSHLDKDEHEGTRILTRDNSFKVSMRGMSDGSMSTKQSAGNSGGAVVSRTVEKTRTLSKETTCLSFLISVCAVYRNRLTVMAGCADIILAIAKSNSSAETALRIAQTSTCTLGVMAHVAGKDTQPTAKSNTSLSLSSPRQVQVVTIETSGAYKTPRLTGSVMSSTGGGGERFCYEHNPELHQPTGTVAIPWAGVKILLRVLMRIYAFRERNGHGHQHLPGADSAGFFPKSQSSRQEENAPHIFEDAPVVQRRVYAALSKLVSQSSEVATFVLNLTGAEELLSNTAADFRKEELTDEMASIIYFCENALKHAKPAIERRRAGHFLTPSKSKSRLDDSLVSIPTHNYKSDPHVLPSYLGSGTTEINLNYKSPESKSGGAGDVKSSGKTVSPQPSSRTPKASARPTKLTLPVPGENTSPDSVKTSQRSPKSSARQSSPEKGGVYSSRSDLPSERGRPKPLESPMSKSSARATPKETIADIISRYSGKQVFDTGNLSSGPKNDDRSISPKSIRPRSESADIDATSVSMESLASSLSTASSVAWVFKNLPNTPKLPKVVSSPQSTLSPNLFRGSMASPGLGEDIDYGAIFDGVADKELKRLLRNGYYVNGRPQTTMQRSSRDLKLGTLLNRATSRASTSHSNRSYNRSPTPSKSLGTLNHFPSREPSPNRLGVADMNWDLESKSLGLRTEFADEDPQIMQNAGAEYSIDIMPTSRAKRVQYSVGDDGTVGSSTSSAGISVITMDSLLLNRQQP